MGAGQPVGSPCALSVGMTSPCHRPTNATSEPTTRLRPSDLAIDVEHDDAQRAQGSEQEVARAAGAVAPDSATVHERVLPREQLIAERLSSSIEDRLAGDADGPFLDVGRWHSVIKRQPAEALQ